MGEPEYQILLGLEDGARVHMQLYHGQMLTTEQQRKRLAFLEREIANYPGWGAALTAMDEEARNLRRNLEDDECESCGGRGYFLVDDGDGYTDEMPCDDCDETGKR